MSISFSLIVAVIMLLPCIEIFCFNSSNFNIHDPDNYLAVNDVVTHTVHYYLQEEEKGLAAIRQ